MRTQNPYENLTNLIIVPSTDMGGIAQLVKSQIAIYGVQVRASLPARCFAGMGF